jgi:hypothetical protein
MYNASVSIKVDTSYFYTAVCVISFPVESAFQEYVQIAWNLYECPTQCLYVVENVNRLR